MKAETIKKQNVMENNLKTYLRGYKSTGNTTAKLDQFHRMPSERQHQRQRKPQTKKVIEARITKLYEKFSLGLAYDGKSKFCVLIDATKNNTIRSSILTN